MSRAGYPPLILPTGTATVSGTGGAFWGPAPRRVARTSGSRTRINRLLSLGRVDIGYFGPDLVEVEGPGLEEGMGHVELERARPALRQGLPDLAVVEAVRPHRIHDAERRLVLGILHHRLAVLARGVHCDLDLVHGPGL